ncbi:MAG: hypothetical protein IK032_06280 [Bacteroidales bacterium]|nr:hypothetical protein [Bacteroidales bacterium]MBR5028904.1 hypothetical protein [Bacteroidales bacterium]
MDEDNFWIVLLLGIGHFLYRIVYLLFVLPVDLWKKAILRMSYQRKNKSLDVDKINHELPFFVWLKRFFFDFVFDGIIIISWVAVAIAIPIIFFSHISLYVSHFEAYMATILPLVIAVFYLPVAISLLKDIITLTVILPSRWIVSFLRRPAKTYDLTHKQEK